MKKVILVIAVVCIVVGVGIMLIPLLKQRDNANTQEKLIQTYEELVEENKKTEELPSPVPQQEKMDFSVNDFIEENSTEETKTIINRQSILGLIKCRALDFEYVVVEGANRDNIRATIGHITGTAGFGGAGNCVLAGHRGGYYGEFFLHIDLLKEGDLVELVDCFGRNYKYEVYEQEVVEPDALWICDSIEGENTLTLLSCEDHGSKRRVVRCRSCTQTKSGHI